MSDDIEMFITVEVMPGDIEVMTRAAKLMANSGDAGCYRMDRLVREASALGFPNDDWREEPSVLPPGAFQMKQDENGNPACPKCGSVSGDSWVFCGGYCPVMGSPDYVSPNYGRTGSLKQHVDHEEEIPF